jgi:hypothetical protein
MQRLLSTAQGQQRRLVSMDGGGGGSPPHAALDGGMQRPLTTEVGRGVSRAEGSPVRANGGNGVAAPSGGMLGVLTRLNTQQAQPRFSAGGSQRLQYRQYDEDDELPRPSTVDPSWGGQGYAAYVPPSTAPGFVPGDASQPRPQSSAPRSTSGSAEWRHSMTTMEHAVLPVPMPSSPQRMRQATATQATRPLTKGLGALPLRPLAAAIANIGFQFPGLAVAHRYHLSRELDAVIGTGQWMSAAGLCAARYD